MSVNPRVGISEIEKLRAYNNMQFVTVNYELSPHQAIGLDVEIAALEVDLTAARKSAAAWKQAAKLGRHITHLNVLYFGANGQSANTVLGSFSDARRHTRKVAREYRRRKAAQP